VATPEQSAASNLANIGSPPPNASISFKQDHKVRPENKATSSSQESSQTAHVKLVNLLESTLWNRKLAPTLEDIVNALVAQIFEGIRDHCVASAEMKVSSVAYYLQWWVSHILRTVHSCLSAPGSLLGVALYFILSLLKYNSMCQKNDLKKYILFLHFLRMLMGPMQVVSLGSLLSLMLILYDMSTSAVQLLLPHANGGQVPSCTARRLGGSLSGRLRRL